MRGPVHGVPISTGYYRRLPTSSESRTRVLDALPVRRPSCRLVGLALEPAVEPAVELVEEPEQVAAVEQASTASVDRRDTQNTSP